MAPFTQPKIARLGVIAHFIVTFQTTFFKQMHVEYVTFEGIKIQTSLKYVQGPHKNL